MYRAELEGSLYFFLVPDSFLISNYLLHCVTQVCLLGCGRLVWKKLLNLLGINIDMYLATSSLIEQFVLVLCSFLFVDIVQICHCQLR